jgi:hypothetical protein
VRHVAGIEGLAVGRLAGLDAGAARHRAGTKGLAADRATGNGPGAAAGHVEGRGTARRGARHVAGIERLAVEHGGPQPYLNSGLDKSPCLRIRPGGLNQSITNAY